MECIMGFTRVFDGDLTNNSQKWSYNPLCLSLTPQMVNTVIYFYY